VTGLGNVFVESYVQMYKEAKIGNYQKVNEMQKKINQLYEIIQVTGGKVIPAIKVGASFMGRSLKWMKMNSLTLNNADAEKVKKILSGLDLL